MAFAGCDYPDSKINVNNFARIQFFGPQGHNILLKENAEFKFDDLRLFYYNREMQYVMKYKARANDPYFVSLDYGLATIYHVIGDDEDNIITGEKYATYLDFGNGDIDTIQAAGFKAQEIIKVTDICYNGKQVLDNGILVQSFDVELPGGAFSVVK